MNKEELIQELKEINVDITNKIQKLDTYADFLLEYNKHTNLTAIKSKEDVYLKHFYDSLTITKIFSFQHERVLDIGTGAGFPGLVLKIMYPDLQITLLDSNNKKITFLKECIKKLELNNVEVIYDRAEEYVKKHREEFDIVTSRAVAELRILIELSLPALKKNGYFIGMKGNIEEELQKSVTTIEKLHTTIKNKIEFELPKNSGHRTLISLEKLEETPTIYPRSYDKIKKKSL